MDSSRGTGGLCAHVYVARHVSGEIDLISMTCELPKRSKVGRPTTVYGGLFVHPVKLPPARRKIFAGFDIDSAAQTVEFIAERCTKMRDDIRVLRKQNFTPNPRTNSLRKPPHRTNTHASAKPPWATPRELHPPEK